MGSSVDAAYIRKLHEDIETAVSLNYHIRPNYRTVRLGFSELLGTLSCGKI